MTLVKKLHPALHELVLGYNLSTYFTLEPEDMVYKRHFSATLFERSEKWLGKRPMSRNSKTLALNNSRFSGS